MYKSLSEALEANLEPSASTEDGAIKVYSIRTPSEWDKISPESKDVLQKYLQLQKVRLRRRMDQNQEDGEQEFRRRISINN